MPGQPPLLNWIFRETNSAGLKARSNPSYAPYSIKTLACLPFLSCSYYVAVMPARLLADGSKELGPASGLQAQPATLGAPQDPPTKPTFRYIGTVRIIQVCRRA